MVAAVIYSVDKLDLLRNSIYRLTREVRKQLFCKVPARSTAFLNFLRATSNGISLGGLLSLGFLFGLGRKLILGICSPG